MEVSSTGILVLVFIVTLVRNVVSRHEYINPANRRCYECHESDFPFTCNTFSKCGNGEVCFTRAFRDQNGKIGYHLGCEEKTRCEFFATAKAMAGTAVTSVVTTTTMTTTPAGGGTLVGRRDAEVDAQDDDNGKLCFACCDTDDCNSHLCMSTLLYNITGKCPPTFHPGPNSCYYMANWTLPWDDARLDCHRRGAEMFSIHDPRDDFFLVGLLNSRPAKSQPRAYWLGGFYISAIDEWAWLNGKPVTYSRWGPGEPEVTSSRDRMSMTNPSSYGIMSTEWMWGSASSSWTLGFICERPYM